MQDSLCQANPLAVAFGKGADELMTLDTESCHAYDLLDTPGRVFNFVDSGYVTEVFPDVHIQVEGIVFREVADQGLDSLIFFGDLDIVNIDLTAICCQIAGDHPHGGGLAGTIWAQESENFTLSYLERDVLNGLLGAKMLGKVRNEYGQLPGVLGE